MTQRAELAERARAVREADSDDLVSLDDLIDKYADPAAADDADADEAS